MVIGVGAYLLSQPRKGSLEFHKRKYREATKWRPWQQWFVDNAPHGLVEKYERRRNADLQSHVDALFALGYWQLGVFTLSNEVDTTSEKRFWTLNTMFTNDPLKGEGITAVRSNSVRVVALSENLSKWEDAIRDLDVPRNK